MLRKDIKMRIARDGRGKITTGNRGKDEKDHPRSLPHFNINEFPEFVAVYGNEPERLLVVFPTDRIEDFYSTEYSQWGTGTGGMKIKKRSCDGEICLDCITREEKPCFCRELPANEQCKCYMALKAFVVNPQNGLIINFAPTLFESHSVNTADAIYSELEKVWVMTGGRLRGIPFVISVDMIEKLNEKGQKTKFPIWKIQVALNIDTALRYAKIAALPTTEETRLAIDATCSIDDNGAKALPQTTEQKGNVISEAQRKRLFTIANKHGVNDATVKDIIGHYGYTSTKDILKTDYEKICSEIAPTPPTLAEVAAGAEKTLHPASEKYG